MKDKNELLKLLGRLKRLVEAQPLKFFRAIQRRLHRHRPVEYGRASGGIISFRSGMGDDRFRFKATNFIPSFKDRQGLTFDKFVPRFTFSGPLRKRAAWFYDGLELEYNNVVIATMSPARKPALRSALKVVTPAQRSGAASAELSSSGMEAIPRFGDHHFRISAICGVALKLWTKECPAGKLVNVLVSA